MSQVNKPDFKRFNSALEVVSQQGALIASMADGEGVQNFVHILSGLRNDMNCLREEVAEMRQKLDGKLKKGQDEIMDTPWDDKRLASESNAQAKAHNANIRGTGKGEKFAPFRADDNTLVPDFPQNLAHLKDIHGTELSELLTKCGIYIAVGQEQGWADPDHDMRVDFLEHIGAINCQL